MPSLSRIVAVILLVTVGVFVRLTDGRRSDCEVFMMDEYKEYNGEDLTKCCDIHNNTSSNYTVCDSGFTSSFTDAMNSDTLKNNTVIVVITDVELSSIKSLKYLEYVTFIGYKNPIVHCRKSRGGGLKVFSCHNCSIEGIAWYGCGSLERPGILFLNSSNILIQDCVFQSSKGQTVALSGMSGDVNIKDCKFVNNSRYHDEGSSIHYTSSDTGILKPALLTISDCDFSYNTAASMIYIGNLNHLHVSVLIKDSSFGSNKGNSISVSKQNLHIGGTMVFKRNRVAGIFATNHSNVIFDEKSKVTFVENGGRAAMSAISLYNYSNLHFEQDSVATFRNNKARDGGAVHLNERSSVVFNDNCNVTFLRNSVSNDGGAIYSYGSSKVIFKSVSIVTFDNNVAKTGAGIFSDLNSKVLFTQDSTVTFNDNNSSQVGGAVFSDSGSKVVFEQNANVSFNRNVALENGGALVVHDNSAVLFDGNTAITFAGNQAHFGAALRSNGNCNITFTENSMVTFTDNIAHYGGAVHSQNHVHLVFEGNSNVAFINNTAIDGGGFYLLAHSTVTFKEHSCITLYNNTARGSGGAIYSRGNSDLSVIESPHVNFTHNVAKTGGAIHVTICNIEFSGTSNVTFKNNVAVHEGGAIYLNDQANIAFDKNIHMILACNGADRGAGMFNDLSKNTTLTFITEQFHHYDNTARIAGDLFYVHVPPSCDASCLEKRIVGLNETDLDIITTPPKRITLHAPTKPMCTNTTEECNAYYVENIMLGQEILISACLKDYYDKPTNDVVQF